MYPAITSVTPLPDYVLSVGFEDGQHGTVDLKPWLDFGVFNRLRDPEVFCKVKVGFDTIEWDNGIDLDPEFVYEKCLGVRK